MISIIIPAYNEEKRIGRTLEEFGRFFKDKQRRKEINNFEIVVVINNTSDRTEEIVKECSKEYEEIRYINLKEGGKGFAIINGFKEALKNKTELIGFVDADLATSPESFYDLIKNIGRHDGIIASRWIRGSIIKTKQTILRRMLSEGFSLIVRFLFFMPYKDTQCGAKIFKRKVIEKIIQELYLTQWAFDVNLLYLCKEKRFIIKEHPTTWQDKKDSKLDLMKTPIQMFSGILRLRIINSKFEPLFRPIRKIVHLAYKILK